MMGPHELASALEIHLGCLQSFGYTI